ncbi:MAG TPA: helix-turn-helix domain-containing protein [Candidatus Limnocylindrales bacterium]|nr:helix-turn-helix domain-containing protein [Candidatus Limnocylindrales bacterium]
MSRTYRLGRRQEAVDQTAQRILVAAQGLVEASPSSGLSVGAVARAAGVTRATVYNRYGSRTGLLRALAPPRVQEDAGAEDPRDAVRTFLGAATAKWAVNPALHRNLGVDDHPSETPRRLAENLAAADALRPGCSLREAEDVLTALASFPVFDRLHKDGRRTPAAVAEILMRLAGGILA